MSIIRAIKHRLGLSVTPANNFVLDASADNGTMKLVRESGQDILTVDAASKLAFPFMPLVGTSPIVEKGSNTNGEYTKFADGLVIQHGYFITTAVGGIEAVPILYPVSVTSTFGLFLNFDIGAGSDPRGWAGATTYGSKTSTGQTIAVYSAGAVGVNWVHIGYWK